MGNGWDDGTPERQHMIIYRNLQKKDALSLAVDLLSDRTFASAGVHVV